MTNNESSFFLALAYTTATEKNLDQSTFLQKVSENEKVFSELQKQQKQQKPNKPDKVKTMDRSMLGI